MSLNTAGVRKEDERAPLYVSEAGGGLPAYSNGQPPADVEARDK